MAEIRTVVLRACVGTALGLSLALSVIMAVFGVYLLHQVKDLRAKDELLVSLARDNKQSLVTLTQLLTNLTDHHQAGVESRGALTAGIERHGSWLQDHHNATDKDLQDLRDDLRSLQEAAGSLEAAVEKSQAILSDSLNKTNGRLDALESAIADLEVQMTENYRDSKQVLKVTGTAIADLEDVVRGVVQASQNASEELFQDLARLVTRQEERLLKSEQNSTSTMLGNLGAAMSEVLRGVMQASQNASEEHRQYLLQQEERLLKSEQNSTSTMLANLRTTISDAQTAVLRGVMQASQNVSEENRRSLAQQEERLLKAEQNSTSTVLASLRSTNSDVQTLQSSLRTQQTQVTGLASSMANNKQSILQEAKAAIGDLERALRDVMQASQNVSVEQLRDLAGLVVQQEERLLKSEQNSTSTLLANLRITMSDAQTAVLSGLIQASQNVSEENRRSLAQQEERLLKAEQNSTSTVLASLRSTNSDVQTLQSNLRAQQTQVTGLVSSVAINKRALDAINSTLSSQGRLLQEVDSELTSNKQSLASVSMKLTQLADKSSTSLLSLHTLQSSVDGFQTAFSGTGNATRQRLDALASQMTQSEAMLLNITSNLDSNRASLLNITELLHNLESDEMSHFQQALSLQNSNKDALRDVLQYVGDIQELLWNDIDNTSLSATIEEAEETMLQLWNLTEDINAIAQANITVLKADFDSLNDTSESETGAFELVVHEVNHTETTMTGYDKVKDKTRGLARNAYNLQIWLLGRRRRDLRQRLPKRCQDYRNAGFTKSGIYPINPHDGYPYFLVYCDMDVFGKGWEVIQRRKDGSVDFYRDWEAYKNGFGNLSGEFWLGNEKIHRLTQSGRDFLRIELEDWQRSRRYAEYNSFLLGNESSNYTMQVSGYDGDAGDSLVGANGFQFSTKDRGPQTYCLSSFSRHGAWWYGNIPYGSCGLSDLNGRYYSTGFLSRSDGIMWFHWRHDSYSYMSAEMKLH